ncbi:CLUMA_CG009691, isoform A [Clunio marinus]|uniref:CLUMA_CG009691, isoform A n=1 Tax=Clunio marinus TaxID=568069 RepID=A0A1J1I9L8_9DIPT|nr:CLUMA_CG009691, isoform A [Clunio marinus]
MKFGVGNVTKYQNNLFRLDAFKRTQFTKDSIDYIIRYGFDCFQQRLHFVIKLLSHSMFAFKQQSY